MKRLQFHNVGTKYWVDFDLDLNDWGKYIRDFYVDGDPLLKSWMDYCNEKLGKGNFVIVATSGGYHTMVNKDIIHWSPNTFIEDFQRLEIDTPMPHPDGSTRLVKNGELIGELVQNTNAMIPVPGTYQYGHVVRVINKGDFPA